MLKSIIHIGVHKDLTRSELAKVQLLNQSALFTLVGLSIVVIQHIVNGNYSIGLWTMISYVILSLSLLLNHFRKYTLARTNLIVFFGIYFVIQHILFGDIIGLTPYYVVFSIFIVVMFESNKKMLALLSIYIIFSYIGCRYATLNLVHPYSFNIPWYVSDIHFLLAMCLSVILLIKILAEKHDYSSLTQKLLKDLEINNKELQSRNDELQRFAYATSHDLKTPLRNISSFVTLIEKNIKNTCGERVNNYISIVENATKQMGDCIEDILLYSSLNHTTHKWSMINLDELIQQVMLNYKYLIDNEKIIISIEKLPHVYGFKNQLKVAFQNIIDNALKYNESEIPKIIIGSSRSKGFTKISLTDNGIGIDSIYQDSIFDPFKRLHGNKKYAGTGLGLSIVRKIIEAHDGKVYVDSSLYEGTTFTFQFPDAILNPKEIIVTPRIKETILQV